MTTQFQSIDKSIGSDVRVIRYDFETQPVSEFFWIHRKLNPANIGTKFDSPLITAVKRSTTVR